MNIHLLIFFDTNLGLLKKDKIAVFVIFIKLKFVHKTVTVRKQFVPITYLSEC